MNERLYRILRPTGIALKTVTEIEQRLGRELSGEEHLAAVATVFLEERDVLLGACKFALSVIKANHPVEASEFMAIDKLEAAIRAVETADEHEAVSALLDKADEGNQ